MRRSPCAARDRPPRAPGTGACARTADPARAPAAADRHSASSEPIAQLQQRRVKVVASSRWRSRYASASRDLTLGWASRGSRLRCARRPAAIRRCAIVPPLSCASSRTTDRPMPCPLTRSSSRAPRSSTRARSSDGNARAVVLDDEPQAVAPRRRVGHAARAVSRTRLRAHLKALSSRLPAISVRSSRSPMNRQPSRDDELARRCRVDVHLEQRAAQRLQRVAHVDRARCRGPCRPTRRRA